MVTGTHILLYSEKADEDRDFFRDVLGFKSVDAGGGWLIFGLPPAELAIHPKNGEGGQSRAMIGAELYLMCADLKATIKKLESKNVRCAQPNTERWGFRTTASLPSGATIGLYQPTHPTAISLGTRKKSKPRTKTRKSAKGKRR